MVAAFVESTIQQDFKTVELTKNCFKFFIKRWEFFIFNQAFNTNITMILICINPKFFINLEKLYGK